MKQLYNLKNWTIYFLDGFIPLYLNYSLPNIGILLIGLFALFMVNQQIESPPRLSSIHLEQSTLSCASTAHRESLV